MTKRRKHPGVSWVRPDAEARIGWRVKYRDPDTGKTTRRTPDAPTRTVAQRESYAVLLSKKLAQRRAELEAGAPRATGTPLPVAIDRYFAAHPRLRPGAVSTYRIGIDRFLAWATKRRVHTCDAVTRAVLMRWRETVINEPKRDPAPYRQRGGKAISPEPRSPHTINREMRNLGTALRYLVDCDLFSRLSHDDIRRALKPINAPLKRKAYLKPAQLRRLLEAALRHDAETYTLTRGEKTRGKAKGATPRYEQIAPFVLFVLLTGMRRGEALALDWKHVDLDALDATGHRVGEIEITTASKTSKARTVGLEVSPACRRLLAAQRLRTGGRGRVWPLTKDEVTAAMKRLRGRGRNGYGAPSEFAWQTLRVTCGTFLSNSPAIYGAASAFMSARQLGHSVEVAEKHYVGLLRGIPRDAHDLETAMQIGDLVESIISSVASRSDGRTRTAI